jgi:hypothetical protein
MRRDNDIVELQNGIIGVGRLGVEDIETRAGNPALLQHLGEGLLIDHRTPCAIDEKGCRLHQLEPSCVDEMSCLLRQRTVERHEIRFAIDGVEIDEADPEFGGERWVDEGSWAMKFMPNGLARRKTSAPILPIPTDPRTRPTRPVPL